MTALVLRANALSIPLPDESVGISLDLSADYCRLARWRIERSGHFEKTLQRTHRDNQGTLL